MKNTVKKINLSLAILFLSGIAFGQLLDKKIDLPESKLYMVKMGPYLGLEQGKYLNFNFGVERQWQQLKLVKPHTHAANVQFSYNFKYKVIGAQVGYWFKAGRMNLTYGGRLVWHTNSDEHRFGFAPNVGYKFMQAHFQLGVNLMPRNTDFSEVNTFYASLRWVFINDRKIKRGN